jgi:predicted Fe-Mo cluster-binding NifX family protein
MTGKAMAKAAFATWNDRIAPVFDVARSIRLVETAGGRIVSQKQVGVTGGMASLKAAYLAELGVGTLVCGAISKPLQTMITAYGIQVIGFVAGNLQEIIQAWVGGKLVGSAYAMPGCRKDGRLGAGHSKRRENKMNNNKRGQRSAGQGKGSGTQGRKGQGRRRSTQASGSGPGASAIQGSCVCPQCGHKEPHQRSVPCARKKCPQCATTMIRQ